MKYFKVVRCADFKVTLLKSCRPFIIQTKPIKIQKWGLPSLNEYIPDDNSRNYIKLYLDPNQRSCKTLENIFTSIDKYYKKDNTMYLPIISTKKEDDGYEDRFMESDEDTQYEYKYCILKFLTDFNDKITMDTILKDSNSKQMINLNIKVASELEKYLVMGSKIQLTLNVDTSDISDNNNFKHGIDLIISQMIITPNKKLLKKEDKISCANTDEFMDICI